MTFGCDRLLPVVNKLASPSPLPPPFACGWGFLGSDMVPLNHGRDLGRPLLRVWFSWQPGFGHRVLCSAVFWIIFNIFWFAGMPLSDLIATSVPMGFRCRIYGSTGSQLPLTWARCPGMIARWLVGGHLSAVDGFKHEHAPYPRHALMGGL